MTKIWEAFFGRRGGEKRSSSNFNPLTLAEWADMFYKGSAYPGAWGYGYSPYQETEGIETNFEGYVRQAYKADGVVFACMQTRMLVFSEARFQYQKMRNGRPGDLFGNPNLHLLEHPWPNGTTGELLSRAIQDVDLAGNHYMVRESATRLRRLRPDWVQIILSAPPAEAIQSDVLGYLYYPGGYGGGIDPHFYPVDQVAHWSPVPDPEAQYRGMSWLTPIVREVQSDKAATKHKSMYFEHAALPNLVFRFPEGVGKAQVEEFVDVMEAESAGVDNAYRNMYVGLGADVTVLSADMRMMDFKQVQGAMETRIAAAAKVHPVLVGLSEGLQGSSLNSGNFNTARDWFGSATMRPLWRSICAAYQVLVPEMSTARLWYDDSDIPALRADKKDIAQIQSMEGTTIVKLITIGFEPDSVTAATMGHDWSLLKHTGLISVQLVPMSAPQAISNPPPPGTQSVMEKDKKAEIDQKNTPQLPVGTSNGQGEKPPPVQPKKGG